MKAAKIQSSFYVFPSLQLRPQCPCGNTEAGGLRASTQPCWLRRSAGRRVGVLGSCLTKLKGELHGQ
jgi:hypothetical protein